MISISNTGAEWMALVKMAQFLVECPIDVAIQYTDDERPILLEALERICDHTPDDAQGSSIYSVLFSVAECGLLQKLIAWFDDELLRMAPYLERLNPAGLVEKYEQVSKLKRTFYYATQEKAEKIGRSGDDSKEC